VAGPQFRGFGGRGYINPQVRRSDRVVTYRSHKPWIKVPVWRNTKTVKSPASASGGLALPRRLSSKQPRITHNSNLLKIYPDARFPRQNASFSLLLKPKISEGTLERSLLSVPFDSSVSLLVPEVSRRTAPRCQLQQWHLEVKSRN
jgi:hypothetical protein